MPNEGPRSIVLVSDGEATCAPPEPCDVAKELKQQGIDLTIHTIGFKVNDVVRGQLSCIAAATGGTYVDADDSTQLEQKLDSGFQRAAQKYAPKGASVHGASRPNNTAPLLDQASTWIPWRRVRPAMPGQVLPDPGAGRDNSLGIGDRHRHQQGPGNESPRGHREFRRGRRPELQPARIGRAERQRLRPGRCSGRHRGTRR